MNTAELEVIVTIIKSVISLVEMIDEKAAENPIVVDLNKAIYALHALGI
jgi:hypothetical protein